MTRTEISELLRENFETVYRVHHQSEYGFGGDTSIWIAVIEETEDEIVGRKYGPRGGLPGGKLTIRKDNVAGWQEARAMYDSIPEEPPTPSVEDLKQAYVRGRIDEDQLENKLEEAGVGQ